MESSRRDHLNDMADNMSILKNDQNTHYTPTFFKIDLCPATSMETSRKEVLNYKAENRSILKNNHNTSPRLIFTFKTAKNSLREVCRFYCETVF